MRFFTARRLALAALVPACLGFSLIPGCSNEGEGERCGGSSADPSGTGDPNNDDCASGLVCVEAMKLVNNQANRCCNASPSIVNDSRCVRSGMGSSGGSGGASSGGASTGGASTGGSGGAMNDAAAGSSDAAAAGATDMSAGGI